MANRPLKFPLTMGMNHVRIAGHPTGPHFAFQKVDGDEKPTLWLTVADGEPQDHKIYVAITGQTLPGKGQEHLGSALTANTAFVAHCYRIED